MHTILIGTCILAGIVAFLNVFVKKNPPHVVRTGSILFALMMWSLALLTFLEYGEPFQWIAALAFLPLLKRIKDLKKVWLFLMRVDYSRIFKIRFYQSHTQHSGAQQKGASGGGEDEMTRQEARRLLGIKEGATQKEIQMAHRRKMQKHHPDQGGDPEIATLINQAKDVLLYRRKIED